MEILLIKLQRREYFFIKKKINFVCWDDYLKKNIKAKYKKFLKRKYFNDKFWFIKETPY